MSGTGVGFFRTPQHTWRSRGRYFYGILRPAPLHGTLQSTAAAGSAASLSWVLHSTEETPDRRRQEVVLITSSVVGCW